MSERVKIEALVTLRTAIICGTILLMGLLIHHNGPKIGGIIAEAIHPEFHTYIDTSGFDHSQRRNKK